MFVASKVVGGGREHDGSMNGGSDEGDKRSFAPTKKRASILVDMFTLRASIEVATQSSAKVSHGKTFD